MRYVAVEVFKCLNGLNPKYVSQLFERKDVQYGLRHDNLILPNFNTNRSEIFYLSWQSPVEYTAPKHKSSQQSNKFQETN